MSSCGHLPLLWFVLQLLAVLLFFLLTGKRAREPLILDKLISIEGIIPPS